MIHMLRFNEEQCSFGPVKQLGKRLDICRLRGANKFNTCIQNQQAKKATQLHKYYLVCNLCKVILPNM